MAKKIKIEQSKYTEDWLPIKDIKNGMIEVEGKIGEGTIKIIPFNCK